MKFRLGFMMFLQYAIWGAWYPVLSAYLQNDLGFNGTQVGMMYSLLPLATIISPLIAGQLADRYFATQHVIAVLQLLGGGFLLWLSTIQSYGLMVWIMFGFTFMFAPTLALTNSITFHHLQDSKREFGWVRVGGTFGWIAIGLILSGWRILVDRGVLDASQGDALLLAGIASLVMGLYSFTLPHTPPDKAAAKPFAFLEALKMLKNKQFAIFLSIVFVVSTQLMFYYMLTGPFLTSAKIGVSDANLSGVMVIAQLAEIFVLTLLLPWYLPKFGMRKTLILGILAWPARYLVFAIGAPRWLVLAGLSLHGFCFVFFFAATQIYMDSMAPRDIRASVQSLLSFVTHGVGMYLGSFFAGWVQNLFSELDADGSILYTNWTLVYTVPTVITVLLAVVFVMTFKEKEM